MALNGAKMTFSAFLATTIHFCGLVVLVTGPARGAAGHGFTRSFRRRPQGANVPLLLPHKGLNPEEGEEGEDKEDVYLRISGARLMFSTTQKLNTSKNPQKSHDMFLQPYLLVLIVTFIFRSSDHLWR